MNRVMFPRPTTIVKFLGQLLFRISRPFQAAQVIMVHDVKLVNHLINTGEHDEAIATLDRVIDSNPTISLLYSMRGYIHQLKLKPEKALADFNEAIRLDSSDTGYYVSRGSVWAALREYGRAIDDFNTAIELEPHIDAYSARGGALLAIGRYIAAIDDYERVIDSRPDAPAYEVRGTAYFFLNLLDDALRDFTTAIQLDPNMISSYMMRGNIHLRRRDHGAAAEEFSQIIARMVDSAGADGLEFINADAISLIYEFAVQDVGTAYCGRGISRARAGDLAGAFSDFGAAIRIMPENAGFYLARAGAYTEHGEHAEAMRDLEVASQLDGRSADIQCMKALVNFNMEEFVEALRGCKGAIDLSPRWADPYSLRGQALMRLGDHRGAIDDFGKAIALGQGRPPDWYGPWHEKRSGMTLTMDLNHQAAYACRGLAYLVLGEGVKGKEDIVEAVELGYSLSGMEEEIAALFSDEKERRRMSDSVTAAVESALTEREAPTRRMPSRERHSEPHTEREAPSEYSSSGDLLTLSKEAYTDLLQELGFYDVRVGRTLKHPESIPSIYFNSRYGFVYFVAYVKDRERYRPSLWRLIAPRRQRDNRNNLITIVPRAGREREAFEELLAGDVAFEVSPPQVQEPAPRVMVNDYRQRNIKDTVNGAPVSGVIHLATCRHVPDSPGRWWSRFNSLKAAQAAFGVQAATCAACLAGKGRRLDRVQRA